MSGSGGCFAEVLSSGVVVSQAVGVAVEVEDYRAVQEAVEHGRGDGGVAEDFAPFNWGWHMFVVTVSCC